MRGEDCTKAGVTNFALKSPDFSLDTLGAFDTVNATRLLDVLRQQHIPMWIVRWVQAFMTDRTTTLVVQGEESASLRVNAGMLQGSPYRQSSFCSIMQNSSKYAMPRV